MFFFETRCTCIVAAEPYYMLALVASRASMVSYSLKTYYVKFDPG